MSSTWVDKMAKAIDEKAADSCHILGEAKIGDIFVAALEAYAEMKTVKLKVLLMEALGELRVHNNDYD